MNVAVVILGNFYEVKRECEGSVFNHYFYSQHYLCDPGIPLPRMEVTFSMRRLSKIEEECKHYMFEIQRMHHQQQEQRENEVQRFTIKYFIPFCKC